MAGKETSPFYPFDPSSPELMKKLIESFGNDGWKYEQYYANNEGYFIMEMKSKSGKKRIEYEDYYGKRVEIRFWDGYRCAFHFEQQIEKKPKTEIKNHINIPVFKSSHGDLSDLVHYGPDGRMNPERNVKGLPKRINMELTLYDFINQIAEAKFGRPHLIKYGF